MTEITAEVVGPVDRPPVPTETPEVWAVFRWYWYESLQEWVFAISGTHASKEMAENYRNPGDILIRIPASGGGK